MCKVSKFTFYSSLQKVNYVSISIDKDLGKPETNEKNLYISIKFIYKGTDNLLW